VFRIQRIGHVLRYYAQLGVSARDRKLHGLLTTRDIGRECGVRDDRADKRK
jgi:hypothetical protein